MNQLTDLLINRDAAEPVDEQISVKLTASEKAMLDMMAADAGMARNVLIRNLIVEAAKSIEAAS